MAEERRVLQRAVRSEEAEVSVERRARAASEFRGREEALWKWEARRVLVPAKEVAE